MARTGIVLAQTQRLTLTGSLRTALRILHLDAKGLSRFLEEQAADIPAMVLRTDEPALGQWLPRWAGVGLGGLSDRAEAQPDQGPSLAAHVLGALPALVPLAAERRIALAVIETLEPTGWLGAGYQDIAGRLNVSHEAVDTVLRKLQGIDPAGLFARDLAECLRLQARDEGVLDAPMQALLDHLPLAAAGRWEEIAERAAVLATDLRTAFARLRAFNPKPGTGFSALASPVREPDLTVRHAESGWRVELNRSSLPSVAIKDDAEGAAKARGLVRMVEGRNETLLSVAQNILNFQRDALERGPQALRPMTMQAVADTLSLHKSTISRVVAGAAVDTPHGTWWLRALFSADMGADTGGAALRARLGQLVADEDRRKPLSDQALSIALSEDGPVVARRTIAKYRSAMGIAPAHRRRQR